MKVMFISHSSQMAGAERALVNIMKFVDRDKISPICIFPKQNGPAKEKIKSLSIPIIEMDYSFYIPGYSNSFNQMYRSFYNLFFTVQPDSIIVNTQVLFPAVLAAKSLNITVVQHSHGLISKELFPLLDEPKWSAIDALHILLSDKVFVPASFIKSIYEERYPCLAEKIKVIHNGTEAGHSVISKYDVYEHQYPVFSMLCTIEKNKGVESFIQAAKIYLEQYGEASFYVYGYGNQVYLNELSKLIDALGISHSFFIKEKTTEVEKIYISSTCIVVASKIESFSLVSIEAMSYGCPVIATKCGGPEEIIDDGIDGYLVNIGDSKKIADRMHNLATIPYLRERFSVAGHEKVIAKYNIEDISRAYCVEILEAKCSSIASDVDKNIFTNIALSFLSEQKTSKIITHEVDGNEYIHLNNASLNIYNPQKKLSFSFSTKRRMNNITYLSGFYQIEHDAHINFIEFYIGEDFSISAFKNGIVGTEIVLNGVIKLNIAYSISDVIFNNGVVRIPIQTLVIPGLSDVEVRLFIRDIPHPVYLKGCRKFPSLRFYPLINFGVLSGIS
ncbi:glycosyltransferase [Aeromonas dhakensis]|uniref:glycosyltransferase n=1 Tax=Aeromonas dhakensis TaxID=196024 RepID=UPI00191E7267|nr:glycosyltransferase [Aeromonas dhakensis]MBL0602046.1 glycosyltransferase [Aeromonas dhakensis]